MISATVKNELPRIVKRNYILSWIHRTRKKTFFFNTKVLNVYLMNSLLDDELNTLSLIIKVCVGFKVAVVVVFDDGESFLVSIITW